MKYFVEKELPEDYKKNGIGKTWALKRLPEIGLVVCVNNKTVIYGDLLKVLTQDEWIELTELYKEDK